MNVTPLTFRRKAALELWRRLALQKTKEHPLQQLFWECTLRCNLHCRHCGSDCKLSTDTPDMPRADFMRVLDSIAAQQDPHHTFVILTGGEPLMRDDLEQCGAEIYARGFPWGMVTNGLLLTQQRFERLLQAGLHTVTVSLDGLEEDHNWMRGNVHSFERVAHAIDMMVAAKPLVFDVVTCVNRRNYAQLEAIRQFLMAKGVQRWRLFTVFPVGRAAADPAMQLSAEEFRGVFQLIKRTRAEGRIKASYGCEGFLGNFEGDVRDHFFSCQAGVSIGSVLADGSIAACPSIRADYRQGNIYEDDFLDVWQHRYQPYRDREWMKRDECAACKYFRYCRGNGMHLRDAGGKLLFCHLQRLQASENMM